jgi:tRNA/rRNA methyltransferase
LPQRSKLPSVHLVLLRPAEPMNLGAVARAMRNFGLTRWTLVEPKTADLVTARRVAVHAQELIEALPVAPSLASAVASARWVVGTTSRGIEGRPALSPREVARQAVGVEGEVALVFGGEESGLSNDDLLQCHALSSIPSAPEQPSLNLGQAVLVYAYELYQATGAAAPSQPAQRERQRADDGALQQVERAIRELLAASGFPDPDRPGHGVRDLASGLRRAGLSPAEARLWVAALRGAERRLRGGH